MGHPMAMNILESRFPADGVEPHRIARERTRRRRRQAGGVAARTGCRLRFCYFDCYDPPALEEVLWGENGAMQSLRRDSIYMDSSTISPELARKIAAARRSLASDSGCAGNWRRLGRKKGRTDFMVGGDAAILADVEPVFARARKEMVSTGLNGEVYTIKLAMNLILALQIDALAEALEMK